MPVPMIVADEFVAGRGKGAVGDVVGTPVPPVVVRNGVVDGGSSVVRFTLEDDDEVAPTDTVVLTADPEGPTIVREPEGPVMKIEVIEPGAVTAPELLELPDGNGAEAEDNGVPGEIPVPLEMLEPLTVGAIPVIVITETID